MPKFMPGYPDVKQVLFFTLSAPAFRRQVVQVITLPAFPVTQLLSAIEFSCPHTLPFRSERKLGIVTG